MRELVIDTETTGLDPTDGHRIVEIAAIELFNHLPTGKVFHRYVNPERDIPEAAQAIHGLTREFLAQHPVFAAIIDEFLEFVAGDALVIHNAEFDLAFIKAEMKRSGVVLPSLRVTDTLQMARQRYPGQPASLDALCRRFAIDLTLREKHGARLDSELLAAVYLELIGGRQPSFDLAAARGAGLLRPAATREALPPRPHAPTAEESAAHAAFLAKLKEPLWRS